MTAVGPSVAVAETDVACLAELVRRRTGIVLGPSKAALVVARIRGRLRALGLSDLGLYCAVLNGPDGEAEIGRLINSLTTNVTGFFREPHHFHHLAETVVTPARQHAGRSFAPPLRIWSAGCASGEEAWSIAMTVLDAWPNGDAGGVSIVATDIDTDVLAAARAGVYAADRLAAVPEPLRARCVETGGRIRETVRALVSFATVNLTGPWPGGPPFDAVFCRNVAIYFDPPARRRLLERLAAVIRPGGWLYLGHSESILPPGLPFGPGDRSIFRREG